MVLMGIDEEKNDLTHQITVLHEVALDLQTLESEDEICNRTVEAAENVLKFDNCIIALEEAGELPIRAQSSRLASDGVTPTMSIDEGIAGKTYRTNESYLFDDVSAVDEANPQGPYKSGVSVPIGEQGVLQAVSEEPDFFSEKDLELVELLVSHTANALERVTYERELEQFTSVVSHDLRNPLNVAHGQLELAQEECSSNHLNHLGEALSRMETLLEELLLLAQQGEIITEIEPVDLREVVEVSWKNVATEDAELISNIDEAEYIKADRARLQQLFENLFRNAVDHVGPDVTIQVGTFKDTFYVEDDGPGIPEPERCQVFDRGYSTAGDGTGFGLNIVQKIGKAHGWDITIKTGVDGGARFEFSQVTRVS